jgi:hypothetical protein
MIARPHRRGLLLGAMATVAAVALPAHIRSAWAQPKARRILFVFKADSASRKTDEAVKTHLEQRGYTVTLHDQYLPAAEACRHDMVAISASVRSRDLMHAYRDLPVPLLTWENDELDDLRMTGRHNGVDYGAVPREHELWMVNAPHPLGAGLPAGARNVYNGNAPMGWGRPGLGASIIATLPGQPDKAAIFCYERGATMDYDFLAPARRAFFLLDNDTFGNLNAEGLKLFDAAVAWTIADPVGIACRA